MKKKKNTECGRLNTVAIMQRIPEIMGLDLQKKGDVWEGGYYIDGRRHYKKDKLKIKEWCNNGVPSIWVHEQGGQSLSLATWLINYGGARDYAHAYGIMMCQSVPDCRNYAESVVKNEVKYVSPEQYNKLEQYELERCPLFTWMCRLFGEAKVREVWSRYHVTTDYYGNAVFWVFDADGNICYDKRIKYLATGRRDKTFGAMRKFKVGDGFTARGLFGGHLIQGDEQINVVESEKSCLLCALYYGGLWVATGGKSNLRDIDPRMVLYADKDAVEEWSNKGAAIAEWWLDEDAAAIGDTGDVGDLIVAKLRKTPMRKVLRDEQGRIIG